MPPDNLAYSILSEANLLNSQFRKFRSADPVLIDDAPFAIHHGQCQFQTELLQQPQSSVVGYVQDSIPIFIYPGICCLDARVLSDSLSHVQLA
jgi:hypothetical protein